MTGSQPLSGAHVYVLAANSTGTGSASLSLLDTDSTGLSDSTGTYVLSASDGSFTIPGYYSCTSTQQLYLYAQGGNAGLGENAAGGELAVLGNCPAPGGTVPSITLNEVTTVAAAFAMAPFATDALHVSSSGTPLALTDIANAFANASKLASTATGAALTTIPAGTANVPQSTIHTLANILNACIQSSGPSSAPCSALFSNVQSGNGAPSDTATAMLDIVHHPANNVAALFALQATAPPFAPSLTTAPNDYTIGIVYTGGGMAGVTSIAADADGNVWFLGVGNNTSQYVGSVTEVAPSGSYLSGDSGYNASLVLPDAMAIDTAGNVWIANAGADLTADTSLVELSSTGAVLSPVGSFSNGSMYLVRSISIDPSGNLWMTAPLYNSLTEMSPSGQFLSGAKGFTGGGLNYPVDLEFEPAGNMWISNDESFAVSEFANSGKPLTGSSGLAVSGFYGGNAAAVDASGNVWFTRQGGYPQISKFSSTGTLLSGPTGYTGGGIATYGGAEYLAIDGDGNVWAPLYNDLISSNITNTGPAVVELSNSGAVLSGPVGYRSGLVLFPLCVAVDGSGDVWISNSERAPKPVNYTDRVTEMIGIAAPVVTPLAAGVRNNTLGSRP